MTFAMVAGWLAGFLALLAFGPYIHAILRGQTKPSRATWFIWSGLGVLMALSYRASGAESTIWVAVSLVIGPILVGLLSIRYGEGGWSALDRMCLVGAVISVLLWWVTGDAEISLCANLAIDFFGLIPTIRKTYFEPGKEDRLAWGITVLSNLVNFFAIDELSFSIIVYPVYMFVMNGIVLMLILQGSSLSLPTRNRVGLKR